MIRCIERENDETGAGRTAAKPRKAGEEDAGGEPRTSGRKKRGQSTPMPESEGSPPPAGKKMRA